MAVKPFEEKTGADKPEPLVSVVVHTRRSVIYQKQIGTKVVDGRTEPVMQNFTANGGEVIEVPPLEAAAMRAHGFLHDPAIGTTAPVDTPPDPRPTINGKDGSVVTGG